MATFRRLLVKSIQIRGKVLGDKKSLVCIPITGSEMKQISKQIEEAVIYNPELIEIRIDLWQSNLFEFISEFLLNIRNMANETPLLVTYRSKREGGLGNLELKELLKLYSAILESDIDMIDFELSMGEVALAPLIEKAKDRNIITVLSYHNFNETPDNVTLMGKLVQAKLIGGDIGKIATMPKIKEDVLTLLSVTTKGYSELDIPIITMSMGEMGKMSRICGGFFGSFITFASLPNQPSAPGQIEVSKLKQILKLIEK